MFELGRIVSTPGALGALEEIDRSAHEFLRRHVRGDWGDLCEFDREQNEIALEQDLRLMSVYQVTEDLKIWIITEWDRSVTTVLLPGEY